MNIENLPQGDVRLLNTSTAQRLLNAPLVARLAYIGKDGTPRVIPVNYVWNVDELVIPAFAGTYKIRDLGVRPDVAVCIDTTDGAPQALMLRGRVTMTEADGVLPEYAVTQRQGRGEEQANAYLEAIDQPGLRMVRISLRPTWVSIVDFGGQRLPARTPAPVRDVLTAAH
jgi:hypothetical protein